MPGGVRTRMTTGFLITGTGRARPAGENGRVCHHPPPWAAAVFYLHVLWASVSLLQLRELRQVPHVNYRPTGYVIEH